jgi:DNA polymerase IV
MPAPDPRPRTSALPASPGGSSSLPLSTLFVDFNAYFASVEQQLVPELRGKPVAVAPVVADSGCCIAASYEAKAFGVKTGVRVGEARRLCPHIVIVDARPSVYVDMHHRLVRAVEKCLPVHGVHSIDEMSCRLMGRERDPAEASTIARRIKTTIAKDVGEHMRCSIGIAPNRFLAKVASDMHKPDGLTIIEQHQIVPRLSALVLIDLPGIGPRMRDRLHSKGVSTVAQLLECDPARLHQLWESVIGRGWHELLRGHDLEELPTRRRSVGHSHVLGPKRRGDAEARAVAIRLLHKAAARMRAIGYAAQRLTLSLRLDTRDHYQPRFPGDSVGAGSGIGWGSHKSSWHADTVFTGGSIDTLEFTRRLAELWSQRPPGRLKHVGVTLSELIAEDQITLPLFSGEANRGKLSKALDAINTKFGKHAVYSAAAHDARDSAKGGIAFQFIPDLNLPDSVE